jgi:alpha-ketoglutarate-dependent taurine dioxygenase
VNESPYQPRGPLPGTIRRQALPLSSGEMVQWRRLAECGLLPLLLEPKVKGLQLAAWAEGRQALLLQQLRQYGAILFRNFSVESVGDFERCVEVIAGGALEYRFRASPRSQVGKNVYTSTDYPANQSIFPHNEHAYSPVFPLQLFFFCASPATAGGETPLGDNRLIFRNIDPAVVARFQHKKIRYVRNYGDGFGLPWQTVFQTDNRGEVERYCRRVGIRVEWKPGDRLRTIQFGPAVVKHPQTGARLWFNHATFFHVSTLPPATRDALLAEFDEPDLPQNTYYGDGSPIEASTLEHLREVYQQAMVQFSWQQGDILWLDNMLTVHARCPFTGPRRVLVAMAEACHNSELSVEE